MRIRELTGYTRTLLRGRRARTMMICTLPLGAELLFRSAEAAVYSLLLYFGEMPPIALFSGRSAVQMSVAAVCALLRLLTVSPLLCAAADRLCGLCSGHRTVPVSRLLLDRRFFRRSIAAALWTRAISLAALVPAVFFGISAWSLMSSGAGPAGSLVAVHSAVLTAVSLLAWISVRISLAAVPFVMAIYPKKSVFYAVRRSFRLMSGRKRVVLRLCGRYVPLMAAIVTIPALLTSLMTAFALSVEIFVMEDEYRERDNTDRAPGENASPRGIPQT
ncbi:MAG: hypothetical protein IJM44_04065 [Ruminococcus sp.]|nr:hypothetical protein [Ruminococcus sp.]